MRTISEGTEENPDGLLTSIPTLPPPRLSVFFNYEISPLQVITRETRESFAHFATSLCAIVGGVLTIAGLVDSLVYGHMRRLREGGAKTGLGFGAAQGKML